MIYLLTSIYLLVLFFYLLFDSTLLFSFLLLSLVVVVVDTSDMFFEVDIVCIFVFKSRKRGMNGWIGMDRTGQDKATCKKNKEE